LYCSKFQVQGKRFKVSGFRFKVSGSKFQVQKFFAPTVVGFKLKPKLSKNGVPILLKSGLSKVKLSLDIHSFIG
jgi:hypothetical protein